MRTERPTHSYEEIRAVMLDVLSGREKSDQQSNRLDYLEASIAEVLARRENPGQSAREHFGGHLPYLSSQDSAHCLEAFWDLFLQRIITFGLDGPKGEYRLTRLGQSILANQQVYFFHDLSTYEALIKSEVPNIDAVTLLYLKEAMQAFRSGCILSATVMLGVATEHTFLLMLETIDANPKHQPTYMSVQKERQILPKMNKFRTTIDKHLSSLPSEVKEDLDTHFAATLAVIRTFRNNAGHPTGRIIDREQAYVLLNLFIPYAKKMYQLRDYFALP